MVLVLFYAVHDCCVNHPSIWLPHLGQLRIWLGDLMWVPLGFSFFLFFYTMEIWMDGFYIDLRKQVVKLCGCVVLLGINLGKNFYFSMGLSNGFTRYHRKGRIGLDGKRERFQIEGSEFKIYHLKKNIFIGHSI